MATAPDQVMGGSRLSHHSWFTSLGSVLRAAPSANIARPNPPFQLWLFGYCPQRHWTGRPAPAGHQPAPRRRSLVNASRESRHSDDADILGSAVTSPPTHIRPLNDGLPARYPRVMGSRTFTSVRGRPTACGTASRAVERRRYSGPSPADLIKARGGASRGGVGNPAQQSIVVKQVPRYDSSPFFLRC